MTAAARPDWSMGLRGWAAQLANLTAVAFVCVLFWLSLQQMFQQATDDRRMFREELSALRDDIRGLAGEVRKLRQD